MTPALLISASTRPKASCARATAAATWLNSATSQVIASTLPPSRRSRVASSVMPAAERASRSSAAPSAASASAAAAPMPRLAPVSTTELPESRPMRSSRLISPTLTPGPRKARGRAGEWLEAPGLRARPSSDDKAPPSDAPRECTSRF
jgi:hypothetical protein